MITVRRYYSLKVIHCGEVFGETEITNLPNILWTEYVCYSMLEKPNFVQKIFTLNSQKMLKERL